MTASAERSSPPVADGTSAPGGKSQVPRSLLYSDSHGDFAVLLWSTYEALMVSQLRGGKVVTQAGRWVLADWFGTSTTAVDDARRELLANVAGGPFLSRSSNPGFKRSVKHVALRLPRDTREGYVAVPNWTRDLVWAGRRRPAGRISPGAWRHYAAVLDKATRDKQTREAVPFDATIQRLGEMLGCSASTVRRRLAELERVGLVEVAERPGGWMQVRPIQDAAEAARVAEAFAEDGRKVIAPRQDPFQVPALSPVSKRYSALPESGTPQGSPTQEAPTTYADPGLPVSDVSPEVDAPGSEAKAGKPKTPHKGRPTPRRQRCRVPREAVEVYRSLPPVLAGQIPEHGSRRVLEAIAGELVHRSAAGLIERVARNWDHFRYRISASEPVRDPVAVAIRLTRRGLDCPDVRCEDGHQLDLDAPCKACEAEGVARTTSQTAKDAHALAEHTPADPAPAVRQPLSSAEADTDAASASAFAPAVDVARYGALARTLLNARTDAERADILAQHARTA